MKRLLIVILFSVISLCAGEVEDNQNACKAEVAIGCQNLGDFYYKGKGLKQDYLEAANYYTKACANGYLGGCSALASMYEMGQGISKDIAKATDLYAKACKGDDFKGCYRSGMIYKEGKGADKEDYLRAKTFFRRAIMDGDLRASKIYRELSAVELYSTEESEDTNFSDTFDENNFSKVKINGKWGIKDTKGGWLFKPQFDYIGEDDYSGSLVYDGGLFLVVQHGKKGIVNTKGKWVLKEYDEILHGQEYMIVDINGWVKVKINGKWGAVDTDGKWIFKPQFDDVEIFTVRGQLTVKHNGKWGFIDTKGKWVIKPKYDEVYLFAENDATGFGRILRNGKEGYMSDIDGLLLEPVLDRNKNSPTLESMYILNKTGLIAMHGDSDKLGILNKKGNWVLEPKFDAIEILEDLIYVQFANQEGYTTFNGKYLNFTSDELYKVLNSN